MSEYKISSVTNRILAMKFASEFIMIYPLMTIMFAERGQVGVTLTKWNQIKLELIAMYQIVSDVRSNTLVEAKGQY